MFCKIKQKGYYYVLYLKKDKDADWHLFKQGRNAAKIETAMKKAEEEEYYVQYETYIDGRKVYTRDTSLPPVKVICEGIQQKPKEDKPWGKGDYIEYLMNDLGIPEEVWKKAVPKRKKWNVEDYNRNLMNDISIGD